MDEVKGAIEDIYKNLTEEQREKAKEFKTVAELMEFAGREGVELPDDMVDAISGGEEIILMPEPEPLPTEPKPGRIHHPDPHPIEVIG